MKVDTTVDGDGKLVAETYKTITPSVEFVRTVRPADYESATVKIYLPCDLPYDADEATIDSTVRSALNRAKRIAFESQGVVHGTDDNGNVVELTEAAGTATGARQPSAPRQQSAPRSQSSGGANNDELWKNLIANRDGWFDNRATKTGRQPDFKQKGTGKGLWLDKAPQFAKDALG